MYAIIHYMNFKKIYFIVPLLLTSLSGCSNVHDEYEICLILSNANAQGYLDHGFNQSCYEAIIDFCEPRDIAYNYYIPNNEDDKGYLDAVNRAVDDGAKLIVCAGYSFTTVIETAANTYQNVKFVLLDDTLEGLNNCVSITFNEEESGYLAGYALGMEGMKTVGFVGGGQEDDNHNKILVNPVVRFGLGFIYGISDAWKFLSQQRGYDEVVKILKSKELPDVLICANDSNAFAVIKALVQMGLRVPIDIGVTGFDDTPLCEKFIPPLTTVQVQKEGMGKEAVARLVDRIQRKDYPKKTELLSVKIIERASVK